VTNVDAPEFVEPDDVPVISDADFPALYRAADKSSLRGQQTYLRIIRAQLVLLVIAAAFGAIPWKNGRYDLAAVVSTIAFALAFVAEVWVSADRPERTWYEGRAVAESVKTLTWRFAVAGQPFPRTEPHPKDLFLKRLGEVAKDIRGDWVVTDGDYSQLSVVVTAIRAKPLPQRRALYLSGRIQDQIKWYGRKSTWNKRRAGFWSVGLAFLTFLGFAAGGLKSAGIITVDVLGLFAAVIAAGGSWLQLKQHRNLVSAYAVTLQELSLIASSAPEGSDEDEWTAFVANAEEAISREHTLWRASRW
jgi:hypothetical protein